MRASIRNIVAAGGALAWAATTVTGQEEAPAVPSGADLTLQEILIDDQGQAGWLVRFRYVVPGLGDLGFAAVEADFPALCATQVIPWVASRDETFGRAVISMAGEAVAFGITAPEITQFFEMYRLENASCIWEGF